MKTAISYLLIFILLFLNIRLIPSYGTGDVDNWLKLIEHIRVTPFPELFPNCTNYDCGVFFPLTYPAGHFILIYLISRFPGLLLSNNHLLFKISLFVFYIFTFGSLFYFYRVIQPSIKKKSALMQILLIYLPTVSLILNSQYLGYTDVYFLPFLIHSFARLYKNKILSSGFFLGLSFLIKWQPVILLPVFVAFLFKNRLSIAKMAMGIGASILLLIPFNTRIISTLGRSFFQGALQDPILSSAFNIQYLVSLALKTFKPSLFGKINAGPINYVDLAAFPNSNFLLIFTKVLFLLMFLLSLWKYLTLNESLEIKDKAKKFYDFVFLSFIIYIGYFTLSASVHENHLIISLVLVMMLHLMDKAVKSVKLIYSLDFITAANLLYFYGYPSRISENLNFFNIPLGIFFSVLSVIFFLHIIFNYFWHV